MGFATGHVLPGRGHDIQKLSLLNVMQHTYSLRLLGFAVINIPLRADSASVMADLQDRSAFLLHNDKKQQCCYAFTNNLMCCLSVSHC